jgi:hypothetical protein
VVFDLREFEIRWETAASATAVEIDGDNAVLRNGALLGVGEGALPVAGRGRSTDIQEMQLVGGARAASFDGAGTFVVDSSFIATFATSFNGENARVESSSFAGGGRGGAVVLGRGAQFTDNRVAGGADVAVRIDGDRVLFRDNYIRHFPDLDAIVVSSNGNVVLDNILTMSSGGGTTAIRVEGTGNVVRGNLALPGELDGARWGAGINFLVDGNFYGDNQMAALEPFIVGTTTQTDWGDNVGF